MAVTINGTTGIETNTDTGKLKVGGDNDLQIYHSGSHSYIDDTGTGQLIIKSDLVKLQATNGEDYLQGHENGAAELYHNGIKQCETSANGLAFPSGKGIDFSATSDNAGKDNELLNDYEEGVYQPTVVGGGGSWTTSSYRYLAYTKIGRLVHVSGYLNITADNSANGDVQVSLPFVASNSLSEASENGALALSLRGHNGSANLYNVTGAISDGQSYFEIVAVAGNGSHVWLGEEHCDASFNLRVGGCYLTDS